MRNVKIVFMSFLVLMLAGSAWAWNAEDHVKVAPNNQGDVLMFPFYAAIDGGYETNLTVVNTSDERSTVAKLIVRSEAFSQELLDFMIYLSPSDVWTGTLKWDAEEDGPVMYSEDDSVLSDLLPDQVIWANTKDEETGELLKPMNQPLINPAGGGDSNMMGYVYVVNAATEAPGAIMDNDTPKLLPREEGSKVSKQVIYDWYSDVSPEEVESTFTPKNILAGFMDFTVQDVSLTSGLNAVALRDYTNKEKLGVGEPTFLGLKARNSLGEVEAALSKENVSLPYQNNEDVTLHFFNFPTKYSDYDVDETEVAGVGGPFFIQNGEGGDFSVPFQFNAYDLEEDTSTEPSPIFSPAPPEETSTFRRELNWIDSPQFPYEEGFTRYTFDFNTEVDTADLVDELAYTGAPVIPVQLNLGQSGLSMKYGSWTDGQVSTTVDGEKLPLDFYQYAD